MDRHYFGEYITDAIVRKEFFVKGINYFVDILLGLYVIHILKNKVAKLHYSKWKQLTLVMFWKKEKVLNRLI